MRSYGFQGGFFPLDRREGSILPGFVASLASCVALFFLFLAHAAQAQTSASGVVTECSTIDAFLAEETGGRIVLRSPGDGARVEDGLPIFEWDFEPSLPVEEVRYSLGLFAVLSDQEAAGEAPPICPIYTREDLSESSLVYDGPALSAAYLWQVRVFDTEGTLLARSDPAMFIVFDFNLCLFLAGPFPAVVCEGGSVDLGAWFFTFGHVGPKTYTLSDGQSVISSGPWPPPQQLSPTETTTYTLTATQGRCQRSRSFTVDVIPAPDAGTASISGAVQQTDPPDWRNDVELCCGSGLKLQTEDSAGSLGWLQSEGCTGLWSPVSGASGTAFNVNPGALTCDPMGPVNVCYQATAGTAAPCEDDESNVVSATFFPPPQAGTLTASPPILCNDGVSTTEVTLTGASGAVTWERDPGCTGAWQPFQPPSNVQFTVGPLTERECYRAVIRSGPCPPVEQILTIGVDQEPVAGTITPSPAEICPGDDAVLTLTGHSGLVQWYSSPTSNLWGSPMVGATNNTVQNTNILDQTTFYGVEVSSPLGVCPPVRSAVVPVTVKSLPSAPTIAGPSLLCIGGSATLTVTSAVEPGTYQWLKDGEPTATGTSLVVTEPGNYQVTLVNDCGEASSNVLVVGLDLLAVEIVGPCCACGQQLELCTVVQPGVPPYQFSWSTGGGGTCIKAAPTSTTSFTVEVTDAIGCRATAEFTVTVCE